ncbi:hypothetical protein [Streptomyces sp. NPDC093261]|uniref:hypothetical protein n=1 Tax=Streptomyces sp. NPDC093261 TaxID=3366037 RepID=UPI003811E60A
MTVHSVWQAPKKPTCTHGRINDYGGPSFPTDSVLWCDECHRYLTYRAWDYWAAWEPVGPLTRLWLRLRRRI